MRRVDLITVYDTSCGSDNIGDKIIMEAVNKQLTNIFPNQLKIHFPTHYPLSSYAKKLAWKNELSFVGGTNLLRNYWRNRAHKNQWAFTCIDSIRMQPAILLGVGWNAYAEDPTRKAKFFYKNSLSDLWIHSVRDNYTVNKLKECGISNVINTGCPTLWDISERTLSSIPHAKADSVVFTLTDYNIDEINDKLLIDCLLNTYGQVYFWPQGAFDLTYYNKLTLNQKKYENISVLASDLTSFDAILIKKNIDYIGTRLHAGIRSLQASKRSIIIGIDNRAEEMRKDLNLPVLPRKRCEEAISFLSVFDFEKIRIPRKEISLWMDQFSKGD